MRTLMVLTLAILLAIGFGIIGPAPPPALADTVNCGQTTVVALDNYYQPTHAQPVIALTLKDGADTSPPAAITTAVASYSDMLKFVLATAPRASSPLATRPATDLVNYSYSTTGAHVWAAIMATNQVPRRE